MSLEQIVDNTRTDKNTTHSYLPLYESLFKNKKETAQNILEIGIQNGGSIKVCLYLLQWIQSLLSLHHG
jgi:hypothetical protein